MNAATKTLDALIVDDESRARRRLRRLLEEGGDVRVVGVAKDGRAAVKAIHDLRPDLVLLDLQMPGMNGFDVLREVPRKELPAVLFVTAYDDYALDAFEVNNVDYLLKPVEPQRLREALARLRRRVRGRRTSSVQRTLLKLLGELSGQTPTTFKDALRKAGAARRGSPFRRLAIRDAGETTHVRQEDIEWVDAAGDYMCVHANGETHIMRVTMKQLERDLDADFLQRVHRSTIVNVRRVESLRPHINGEYFLTLHGGHTVKLSRSYRGKLRYLR
ncbi:MAG: LytTR family DNA-binding domain-containing protein [Gammaproteobacteria bacterium]